MLTSYYPLTPKGATRNTMRTYTIVGHAEAVVEMEKAPHKHDVLCLFTPVTPVNYPHQNQQVADIVWLARSVLLQSYFDFEEPFEDMRIPRLSDVEHALKFARGKGDLIVACNAGQSRSSANAYVLACEEVGPEAALQILNPRRHRPNLLVVEHGSVILGKPEMNDLIAQWTNEQAMRYQKWLQWAP